MSAAKAKGTAYESLCVRALRAFGIDARRVAQEGYTDTGDLHGVSPWVGQCKAYRSWEDAIRLGLDGAEKQRLHARESYGVAFVKRVRRSVGESYAVQTFATWARVYVRLRRAESLLAEHAPDAFAEHVRATAAELAQPFPSGTERV
ncbi:hypothetical protein GA0070616_4587 [Micromonospora nigra]|uniref:Holliday junction resolvase n=1 Tax=Micromonospora nigra TaxID=145857 RepID=A0A1C6STQ8_9ACTN|nr:hypothetical protein [Micromonospora nigra]SCL32911.1 hypothetical protein GA0070616_4587 [Micromonospora nigra]